MDIERAIESIGACGLWQFWVYFWIFYAVCFFAAVNLCIVFMQYIPDFICVNPLTVNSTWTFKQIQEISTPKQDVGNEFNGCKYYNRSYTELAKLGPNYTYVKKMLFGNNSIYDAPEEYTSLETIDCPHFRVGHPYDWDIGAGMDLSVVNQWNLVCEDAFQVSNTSTAYMVGFFFGCLCASVFADRFGRKRVFILSAFTAGVLGIADAWMPNFYAFMVFRFLMAFALTIGSPTLYVLCLELCTDSVRKPMGALYFISYSVGYAGLAGVAYFIRDWRILHTVCASTLLISPLFYWFIPESPRWLVSQGREKEAIKVLEWAARWNKKKISPETWAPKASFQEPGSQPTPPKQAESTNFFLVFRHPRLAVRTLNIFFNWIVNTFVYYGISYLITSFSGNIFLNNAISGALETPAYLLCYPLLFWARKKSLMVLLIIAGISCMLYLPFAENGPTWVQLLVAFIGKLAITASFNLIFLVTLELYPTSIRGASVALSSMFARVGAIAAPWVVLIGQKNKALIWIPMVIFGSFALAAGILTFFLPESQNQPLPETIEEALNYPPKRKEEPKEEENIEFNRF